MKSNYRSGVRLFFSQLSILDILSGFYVLLSVLSIVLTSYGLVMWRIALPSFDLVDHHEFLAAAAKGQLDWHDLWARHNDVHLIVLPKIVFFLDMWLGRGSGLFSIAVSCTAIFLTVFLLCNVISRCCFLDKKSARFFCVLVFFTMSSDIFFESLLNPVDIQWSLLALGVVLLASGLDEWVNYGKKSWLSVLSGALIAGLSAGPLAFILSALLLAFVMTGMHAGLYRRRLAYIVLLVLAGGMVWELFAWYAHSDLLLLPMLMKPTTAPADWQVIAEKFLHEHPEFYVTLFYKSLAFVGDFAGVPAVSAFSSTTVSVIFFVCWFLLLLYSSRQWEKSRFFFLYLLAFSFLIAVAAGLFRVGDLYGYRHANIGFLLQLSSLVLIYSAIP
ncbi:MAG TPA: hypothetical protein PLF22_10885, partial [Pseudomonadales bacterium]|nr:hypothetical protein [Pseudomonadales bacterium]